MAGAVHTVTSHKALGDNQRGLNQMTYGTVEHWTLIVKHRSGRIGQERFHSWEAATEAYRDAVKANPVSATMYAVQRRGQGRIKTWDYEAVK